MPVRRGRKAEREEGRKARREDKAERCARADEAYFSHPHTPSPRDSEVPRAPPSGRAGRLADGRSHHHRSPETVS